MSQVRLKNMCDDRWQRYQKALKWDTSIYSNYQMNNKNPQLSSQNRHVKKYFYKLSSQFVKHDTHIYKNSLVKKQTKNSNNSLITGSLLLCLINRENKCLDRKERKRNKHTFWSQVLPWPSVWGPGLQHSGTLDQCSETAPGFPWP